MHLIKKKNKYSFILQSYISKKIVSLTLSWHRKKEPVGEPLMPSCLYTGLPWGKSIHQVALTFAAVISLMWRGAAGEGVETVHPPRGRISLLAGNVYPNSHSVFLTSPQRSSPQLCYNTANLWKGVGKLLESSPKVMCYMSLGALQNTYSTGCFLPTLAYRWSYESIKRKLYFLFLIILCLFLYWKFLFCWHW